MENQSDTRLPKHYALSDLTRSMSIQFRKTYSGKYWIVAEINKLGHYPQKGHAYPTLVEKKDGKIIAEIKGFIVNYLFRKIDDNFISITGKSLSDGMQVLMLCRPVYHAVHGLSLQIFDIEPRYTIGEMARLRAEALEKLKAENLLHRNKMCYLPLLIRRLAVVSVETSKGYRDFTDSLRASPYFPNIEIRLFNALLQGNDAVASIKSALARIRIIAAEFDAVAIIRGGGSETGLDCYDTYSLAREVALFPVPVITGIGHATNLTVVEQVAHRNMITPTELARFVIDRFTSFEQRIAQARKSIAALRINRLRGHSDALRILQKEVGSNVRRSLERESDSLARSGRRLGLLVNSALSEAAKMVENRLPNQLSQGIAMKLRDQNHRLATLPALLSASAERRITDSEKNLNFIADKLRILDPQNTLKRGFSITMHNGKPVMSNEDLQPGDTLETRLWKGSVKSTITQ